MTTTTPEPYSNKPLYGGAIHVNIPSHYVDASDGPYPIPDSQEVFFDPEMSFPDDQEDKRHNSIIVDICQHVTDTDDALVTHLSDVYERTGVAGDLSRCKVVKRWNDEHLDRVVNDPKKQSQQQNKHQIYSAHSLLAVIHESGYPSHGEFNRESAINDHSTLQSYGGLENNKYNVMIMILVQIPDHETDLVFTINTLQYDAPDASWIDFDWEAEEMSEQNRRKFSTVQKALQHRRAILGTLEVRDFNLFNG